jgi:diguanylate cyclase
VPEIDDLEIVFDLDDDSCDEATRPAVVRECDVAIHVQAGRRLSERAPRWAEVLLRLPGTTVGDVPVAQVIKRAERLGLMSRLSRQVVRQAAALDQRLRLLGLPLDLLSINLSASQLADEGLPDELTEAVEVAGSSPTAFALEVTETAALEDARAARVVLDRLRERGFTIMLDDFGSGASSLQRLVDLPVDALKIDRSLLVDAHRDRTRRIVLASAVHLALDLGKLAIIEGVETADDAQLAVELGADIAQGWFFAVPQAPDFGVLELADWDVWEPGPR